MAYANILYWPIFGGKMLTAGVMGLVRRFRYILVTPALLQLLEPDEIDAVIAHEIGHIKKKHLVFYLFFFVGFMLLASFSFNVIRFVSSYSESIFWLLTASGLEQTAFQPIVISLFFVAIFLIYFRFVFGYFMRNFERQADCYVYALFDNARGLISTLEKIASMSGQSADRPNWHHFSIGQRIGYLEKCEADPRWIKRQDAKVRKSIGAFFAALVILAAVGYQFSFGTIGTRTNIDYLNLAIRKFPDNPYLYASLGDNYYSLEAYSSAARAYEQSLVLAAENAYVLNNLAWLYATCPVPEVCRPERALALALEAAKLNDSHYVLDTLAESYYANGLYDQAVDSAKRALAKARTSSERKMYKQQLERFTGALMREKIE
jgi:predicted Zn-dependent protease